MPSIQRIKIVGAGVIGLSVACVLAEAGYEIEIVADRTGEETTSAVAAACWEPYHVGNADSLWGEDSYNHFVALLEDQGAGITLVSLRRLFQSSDERVTWEAENPWHVSMPVIRYREIDRRDVPAGFAEGVCYDVPVIHMPSYLKYLERRLQRLGVPPIAVRFVHTLEDETRTADLVVNCTGLGSRRIADVKDMDLVAYRGQIVIVAYTPEVSEATLVTTGDKFASFPLYIIPRGTHDIVLGGTYIPQADERTEPDDEQTRMIVARCIGLCPILKVLPNPKVKVGLRPFRSSGVRLGLDHSRKFSKPVIHNYGHGGGGVTVSWGCALEVRRHIQSLELSL